MKFARILIVFLVSSFIVAGCSKEEPADPKGPDIGSMAKDSGMKPDATSKDAAPSAAK